MGPLILRRIRLISHVKFSHGKLVVVSQIGVIGAERFLLSSPERERERKKERRRDF